MILQDLKQIYYGQVLIKDANHLSSSYIWTIPKELMQRIIKNINISFSPGCVDHWMEITLEKENKNGANN